MPDTATRVTIRQLEYVAIETPPLRPAFDTDGEELEFLIDEYVDLPEPFAAALVTLTGAIGAARCDCCWHGTGYLLTDGDTPRRNGVRWQTTALVRESAGPVKWQCVDCMPLPLSDSAS